MNAIRLLLIVTILASLIVITEPARAQEEALAAVGGSAVVIPDGESTTVSVPRTARERPLIPGIIALYGGTLVAGAALVQERVARAAR